MDDDEAGMMVEMIDDGGGKIWFVVLSHNTLCYICIWAGCVCISYIKI